MGGKPVGVFLLLASCVGCHACSCGYDYLPPVANGQYAVPGQRAGSAFGGPIYHGPSHNGPLPDTAEEVIDKQASVQVNHRDEITRTRDELLATK